MRAYRIVSGCVALALTVPVFADTTIYDDGELKQTYRVETCGSGEACVNKLVTNISQRFVYTSESYSNLLNRLSAFGVETSVFDANWNEPMEVNATMKINGQAVYSEITRRECVPCKKRRRKNPSETLNILYSRAVPGDIIEFVFEPISAPINSSSFTINVKRYENSTVVGSQSGAWLTGPSPGSEAHAQ